MTIDAWDLLERGLQDEEEDFYHSKIYNEKKKYIM
jgi:hypothetical protein